MDRKKSFGKNKVFSLLISRISGIYIVIILALFPTFLYGQGDRIKFVVQKAGTRIPVIQILQDLNFQFKGKKVFIPHPTLLSTPPIVFHSTMTLSYPEIRAVLKVNGIELIESKVNGKTIVTAYSTTSIGSLRAGATPFFGPKDKLPKENLMVTQAFPIKYVDGNRLFALLRSIIFSDPNRLGNIFYVQGSGMLIVRDLKENVEYYGKIIQALDKPQEEWVVKVVQLKYAAADEVAQKATQMFQATAQAKQIQVGTRMPVQVIGDKRTNKIILFAPKKEVAKYVKLILELDEKVQESIEGKFHVLKLQNVKADDLGPKLNELLTGQSQTGVTSAASQPGSNPAQKKLPTRIIADPKSNSLIIQAEPKDYKKILKLVEKLDISPPQVLIESHIFEVEESRSLNIGAELATFDPSVANHIRGAGLTNFGLSQLIIDPNNPNRIRRIPNALQGVIAGLHKGGFDRLPLIVNLLGVDRTTNILAEPFAVTNDNEEAVFKDETEIPTIQQNQTSSNGNFITQQGSVTASTTLKITPHISPGDYLRLDIDLQLEDFAAQSVIQNTTPPKTRRSYKGSVTVKNGKFLVIGGLTRKDFTQTINKVPLLGDIPYLGWFFSNRTKTIRHFNIYIFIRAYILTKDSNRDERVTNYWLRKAVKTTNHDPRENYGADFTKSQIKEKIRKLLGNGDEDF
ncbi:MAG: hypothetical protein D6785_01985 [Planctomycetota bacterium]|nr:MAG: hypothetical protein D6785_01985 [Planctomycetota bacterium]